MSACGRGNVRDDVIGAGDAGGLAVADQLMASAGRAGGHRPGYGHHRAAELAGVPRGVQCAAAQPRLRDHGARGQGGDEAVAGQEPVPLRELAGRVFTDHGSVCRDAGQQIRMPPGIGVIHAAGQHRDGRATGHQSPVVRGGVDAVGGTGDDGPSLAGEATAIWLAT